MSKEFEEIVLKKLDNLENGLKDNKQELKNLATKVEDNTQRLGKLETQVGKLETQVGKLETQVCELDAEVKNTKQCLQTLTVKVDERFGKVENRLGKLEMEVKDTGEVVNYLNQRFTKFDYEINKKIDTLFDAFTTNKDKNSVHEKEIVSLNAKVFNQDIRISNLEDKVLTA